MRTGTAVPHVAQDVHLVYGQALYHLADGRDEVACLSRLHYAVYDALEVGLLVAVLGILVHEFLYDVGKLLGQGLAHLAAGVLAAHALAHTDEAQERVAIEIGRKFLFLSLQEFQFLLGVVYQRAEFADTFLAEFVPVEFANLALYVARCIAQDMFEGLVLSVYVCHEVLRSLWQVQYRFKIDDFRACRLHAGEVLCQQTQKSHVGLDTFGHIVLSVLHSSIKCSNLSTNVLF